MSVTNIHHRGNGISLENGILWKCRRSVFRWQINEKFPQNTYRSSDIEIYVHSHVFYVNAIKLKVYLKLLIARKNTEIDDIHSSSLGMTKYNSQDNARKEKEILADGTIWNSLRLSKTFIRSRVCGQNKFAQFWAEEDRVERYRDGARDKRESLDESGREVCERIDSDEVETFRR